MDRDKLRKFGFPIAAAVVAGMACAGFAFATTAGGGAQATGSLNSPDLSETVYYDGDGDAYRVDANGMVYDWDDGRWQPELDLKVEGGKVYEFENGKWVLKDAPPANAQKQAADKPAAEAGAGQKPAAGAGAEQQAPAEQPAGQQPAEPAQDNAAAPAAPAAPAQPAQQAPTPAPAQQGGGWAPENDEKVEGGQVYEYDDGAWQVEHDKKVEGGQVYEYDDGAWEPEYDKKVEGGQVYDYDDHDRDDWDDDRDDWDD